MTCVLYSSDALHEEQTKQIKQSDLILSCEATSLTLVYAFIMV